MTFTHDIAHAFPSTLPVSTQDRFRQLLEQVRPHIATLAAKKKNNSLPMLNLPTLIDDLAEIDEVAAHMRSRFRDVVVLGTGGSSLGGKTLVSLKENIFARQEGTRVHFVDNVDPHTLQQMLATLPMSSTGFLVISKSGSTAETITQLLLVMEAIKEHLSQDAFASHIIMLTIKADSPMTRIAATHGIRVIAHDPAVGGRYSVLSSVGLIPAAIAGVDIRALRAGAAEAMENALESSLLIKNHAAVGAALHVALMEAGRHVAVLMPYADRLSCFGMWYVQLWAESLGKQGKGSTPVRAIGAVDQHSQLQLYLDGPADKFISFLVLDNGAMGTDIVGVPHGDASLNYLRGKRAGDVLQALQTGTIESLHRQGCPLRIMQLSKLDERTLGALLMHFMLETIYCADLLGINAFDQPAVEESKVIAREYLLKGSVLQAAV